MAIATTPPLRGSIVATDVVVASMPLARTTTLPSFAALLFMSAVAATPMMFEGSIVARILAASDVDVASLYGIDLVAAALGRFRRSSSSAALRPSASARDRRGAGARRRGDCDAARAFGRRDAERARRAAPFWSTRRPPDLVSAIPEGEPRSAEAPYFEAWNSLSHMSLEQVSVLRATDYLCGRFAVRAERAQGAPRSR